MAAATAKKPSATKTKTATAKPVANKNGIPAPTVQKTGRALQRFAYTGKRSDELKPQTPQCLALVHGMSGDLESKAFNDKDFTLQQLVDLCVDEDILSMPNTKKPDNQKRRIIACYKQRLVDEGYIKRIG
tara:strand:+ start:945 stop:1334 length:390 start_codon:yes stop_codon:yes gene_type:complete